MIVYVDLLFLFNFLLNIIFLVVIEIIYKSKINTFRIIFGAVIGGLIVVVGYFDYLIFNLFKIFGGILICWVGFGKSNVKENLVKYSSFYILNLASVGLGQAFGINTHILLFLSLGVIIVVYFIESNKNIFIFSNRLKYNIIVNFQKTSLNLIGYLDTGNFSELNQLPIIYISDKYYNEDLQIEEYSLVEVATVNAVSYLRAYKPSSCYLKKNGVLEKIDVLVVFTKILNYQCLLNVKVFL